jgi:hypothetical protein
MDSAAVLGDSDTCPEADFFASSFVPLGISGIAWDICQLPPALKLFNSTPF